MNIYKASGTVNGKTIYEKGYGTVDRVQRNG